MMSDYTIHSSFLSPLAYRRGDGGEASLFTSYKGPAVEVAADEVAEDFREIDDYKR